MSGEERRSRPPSRPAAETVEVAAQRRRARLRRRQPGAGRRRRRHARALRQRAPRRDVKGGGMVKDPLLLREALSALHAVVKSDFRYVPQGPHRLPRLPAHAPAGLGAEPVGGPARLRRLALAQRPARVPDPRPHRLGAPGRALVRGLQQGRGLLRQARRSTSAARSTPATDAPVYGTTNIDFSDALLRRRAADAQLPRDAALRRPRRGSGRRARRPPAHPRCWRRRSPSPTRGCAASSRCSPRARCRARWRASRPSISTTCSATCACTATRRRAAAACASSWSPASRRAWCWSRGSW